MSNDVREQIREIAEFQQSNRRPIELHELDDASPHTVDVIPRRRVSGPLVALVVMTVILVLVGGVSLLVNPSETTPPADTLTPTTVSSTTNTVEERPGVRGERFVIDEPTPSSVALGPITWTLLEGPADTLPFMIVKSEDGGYRGYNNQSQVFESEDALLWTESTVLPKDPPLSYDSPWSLSYDPFAVTIRTDGGSRTVELAGYSGNQYYAVGSSVLLILNPFPDRSGQVDRPILVVNRRGDVSEVQPPWQGPASVRRLESGSFVAYTPVEPVGIAESPTDPIEVWTSNDGISWTYGGELDIDYEGAVRVMINPRSDGRIIADVAFNYYERWETYDGVNWTQTPVNTPVPFHTSKFDYGHVLFTLDASDELSGFWLSTDNGDKWEHISGPDDMPPDNVAEGSGSFSAAGGIVYFVHNPGGNFGDGGGIRLWIGRFLEAAG